MSTATIENITQQIDEVKGLLQTFVPGKHTSNQFGREAEYDAKLLKRQLQEVIHDLAGLTRAPVKFVRLSTFKERLAIKDSLTRIVHFLNRQDYDGVADLLDRLKPIVSRYGTRPSSETEQVLRERISDLNEKLVELEKTAWAANDLQLRSQAASERFKQLLTEAQSRAETISSTVERIEERANQLETQAQKTEEYETHLDEYKKKHEDMKDEAFKLIQSARDALEYKTAEGISAAFTERYREERERIRWSLGWVVGAALFVVIAGGIGFFMIHGQENMSVGMSIARIAIMSVAISAAWFCAAQYVRYKNTRDDYGYKSVLAKSIVGFLDRFEDEERTDYLKIVLSEIHQDPLRKKHDVDTPASKLWERFGKRKGKQPKVDTEGSE